MAKLNIPITKAKTTLEIDTDGIPNDVYQEIMVQGLKVLLNRGTSKLTKETISDPEALKAEALRVANEQLELVRTSKIRFTGGKPKKASGAVMTEARRLAKALVKDAMKANGFKAAHVAAKVITAAAEKLIEADPSIVEQAKANLEERAKKPIAIDVKALIHEDPKRAAKAKAKTDKAGTLSAKQAGKPKHRPTGEAQAPQAVQ